MFGQVCATRCCQSLVVDAGVEEISPAGWFVPGWYGYALWVHPGEVFCGAVRCPCRGGRSWVAGLVVGGLRTG